MTVAMFLGFSIYKMDQVTKCYEMAKHQPISLIHLRPWKCNEMIYFFNNF